MSTYTASLRKLANIATEIRNVIKTNTNNVKSTVRVHTDRSASIDVQYNTARNTQIAFFHQLQTLQGIYSRIRRVVAENNAKLGINDVLQEVREVEDKLSVYQAFTPYDNDTKSCADTLVDAYAIIKARKEDTSSLRRINSSDTVDVVLEPVTETILEDIAGLQRTLKKLKNETLLEKNLTKVNLPLSEEESALLESLNIL